MKPQECPNCHYPAPDRKKPDEAAPTSLYQTPEHPEHNDGECPQCHYKPTEEQKEAE